MLLPFLELSKDVFLPGTTHWRARQETIVQASTTARYPPGTSATASWTPSLQGVKGLSSLPPTTCLHLSQKIDGKSPLVRVTAKEALAAKQAWMPTIASRAARYCRKPMSLLRCSCYNKACSSQFSREPLYRQRCINRCFQQPSGQDRCEQL